MIILPRCVLPADKSFRLPSPNRPLREPPSCNSRYKVAQSGDAVARELEAHLKTLEQSFSDIDDFFKEQVELPFMYRYIKRDEIQESITRHNQSVQDYILLFSLGVNLSHANTLRRHPESKGDRLDFGRILTLPARHVPHHALLQPVPDSILIDALLSTGPSGALRGWEARTYGVFEDDIDFEPFENDEENPLFAGYLSLPLKNIWTARNITPPKEEEPVSKWILDQVNGREQYMWVPPPEIVADSQCSHPLHRSQLAIILIFACTPAHHTQTGNASPSSSPIS
ncbi:hypothetical protein DFH08DRAFT_1051122 [Mycena albidolilacea]|uniref:Uncharacterized protein n=1 Tax=Mycena albidolilacea TaxID=1033008 RepID=A0AAD7EBG2_9AGAR|nr:hypothetical protein DFH08DRAFT_1051122 [Mycena albidolilacea]